MLVTSMALVGVMRIKEARDVFKDKVRHGHLREPSWQERKLERRAHQGHGRGR